MSVAPLLRLTAVMGFACVTKIVTLGGALALYGWPPSQNAWWIMLLLPPGLFYVIRILLGIVGPIALTPLVWKTARIHATQSATGILYASVVLVLIGELSANFLLVLTPLPF
jgi:protein NrfD